MPKVQGYGKKRKFVRRRRFVARRRNSYGNKINAIGNQQNPMRSLSLRISSPNPFPESMRRQHTYCEMFTLTTGNLLFGTQQAFRLNSVYDMNYTGAGHQPYGHDQMAALYGKTRVLKCYVQLTFTTPGSASDVLCLMSCSPNTTSGLTGAQLYAPIETPGSTYGTLPSSGSRRCILSQTYDMEKIFGVSHETYMGGDVYTAVVGTSPSKEVILTTAVACYDGTNAVACTLQAVFIIDVLWYDRTTLGPS